MPLTWNPAAALSTVEPLMDWLATAFSESTACQYLADAATAAEALEKIIVGPTEDPWEQLASGGYKASIDDLENILFRLNIRESRDNAQDVTEPEAASSCPDEGGTLEIWGSRQIRKSEWEDLGENGVFRTVSDAVSAMLHDVKQAATLYHRIAFRKVTAPTFNSGDSVSAQGRYLWWHVECDWGDRAEQGGEA